MPRRRGLASLGPDAAAGGAGRGEPALRARLGHWPACWAKAGAPLPAGSEPGLHGLGRPLRSRNKGVGRHPIPAAVLFYASAVQ